MLKSYDKDFKNMELNEFHIHMWMKFYLFH